MFEVIAKPFGALMLWLYNWTSNYGVAVILFALVVKLIMLPFQLKSKKSMMRMSRMTPRLKELEKKFGNDQQRYQQEMSKLYKEEGINPMSGCFWSLLPFPILLALYRAIRYPLTTMMGVDSALLGEGGAITTKLAELGYTAAGNSAYAQIGQSQFITQHFDQFASLSEKLQPLYYNFLGLDLGAVPNWRVWTWSGFTWGDLGLFLIPIVSAALSYLSMRITNAVNPQTQANQQSNMTMMLMMPLMSLIICFSMPGVLGIYWIAQSVFAILQEIVLTRIFTRQLDIEDADRIEREKARAAELEAKREETERLKAEGITLENKNTSKKNKKAADKQKEAERKAAEARAEKARKRAERGEVDDIPESQVGNRRYARGRAYVADRYTNPDEAEEKTLAAAAESEQYEQEHPDPADDDTDLDVFDAEDGTEAADDDMDAPELEDEALEDEEPPLEEEGPEDGEGDPEDGEEDPEDENEGE